MVNDRKGKVIPIMRLSDISKEWNEDAIRWRGSIMTGLHAHWCVDWDGLPIDETSLEYPCACIEDHEVIRTTS